MKKDRFIDIKIKDIEKTGTIEISESNYSFSMNMGKLLKVLMEEEFLLLFQFDKGEIRIETSLEELFSTMPNQTNR